MPIILCAILVFALSACGHKAPTWQEQYDLGVRYLSDGNYEEAILAFTASIEIDPISQAAYIGRADAYMGLISSLDHTDIENENYAYAEKDYLKALELDGESIEVYKKLANLYIATNRYEMAIQIIQEGYNKTGDETLRSYLLDNGIVDLENMAQNYPALFFDRVISPESLTVMDVPFYELTLDAAKAADPDAYPLSGSDGWQIQSPHSYQVMLSEGQIIVICTGPDSPVGPICKGMSIEQALGALGCSQFGIGYIDTHKYSDYTFNFTERMCTSVSALDNADTFEKTVTFNFGEYYIVLSFSNRTLTSLETHCILPVVRLENVKLYLVYNGDAYRATWEAYMQQYEGCAIDGSSVRFETPVTYSMGNKTQEVAIASFGFAQSIDSNSIPREGHLIATGNLFYWGESEISIDTDSYGKTHYCYHPVREFNFAAESFEVIG